MLLEDLYGLTTEQKFQKASEFSGVPADVLNRQWAVESSRGKNLVGPMTKYGQAKGHFQFIDDTAKTLEGRLGVKYDPASFDVGLLFAAHQWKENMTRYGDVAMAAAAYHGGTNKANWGDMTRDYVAKLTGSTPAAPAAKESPAGAATAGFESLPGGPDQAAIQASLALGGMARAEALAGIEVDRAPSAAAQAAAEAAHAREQAAGLGKVLQTSWSSADDMATRWLIDAILRPEETAPAGWSYDTVAPEVEKGKTDEERAILRENGINGPAALQRALAEIEQRRKDNEVYRDAGTFNTVLGRLAVGMIDPASVITGFGIGKALHVAKVGHAALTAAGKGKAAAAALVAENVAGNVAVEGIMDLSGKVSSAEDYAFAAAAAAAITAPFTRGVYRKAADNALADEADAIKTRAITEDPKADTLEQREVLVEQQARTIRDTVTTKNEDADKAVPEHLRRQVEEEAGDAVPPVVEPVVPKPAKAKKAKKPKAADKPAEPTPMTDKEVDDALDQIEANAKTDGWTPQQTVKAIDDLGSRDTFDMSKLSDTVQDRISTLWSDGTEAARVSPMKPAPVGRVSLTTDGKPLKVTTGWWPQWRNKVTADDLIARNTAAGEPIPDSVRYLSEALADVKHVSTSEAVLKWVRAFGKITPGGSVRVTKEDRVLGQIADYLLKTIKDTGLSGTVVTFSKHAKMTDNEFRGRGGYFEESEQILVPSDSFNFSTKEWNEGAKAGSLGSVMRSLVQHGRVTAVHEIGHGVLYTIMAHVEKVSKGLVPMGNLDPAVLNAVKGIEDLRVRAEAAMPPGTPRGYGIGYATTDMHEFVAQVLSDVDTITFLSHMPASPSFGGRFSNAWKEAIGHIKAILGLPVHPTGNTAYDELMWNIEQLLIRRDVPIVTSGGLKTPSYPGAAPVPGGGAAWPGNGAPQQALPVEFLEAGMPADFAAAPNLRNPQAVAISRRKFAKDMYDHARDFMSRNPINMEKLKVFTAKFGAASDGLVLAASKNPICQMVASLITETTTGAAGRKVTAALRRESLYRQLMGNGLIDYDSAYSSWAARNGGGFTNDVLKGDARRKFDKEVYTEVLNRRTNGGVMTNGVDPAVGRAVMALEASFERALKAQKAGNTLGSKRLPANSVGYIPQALDGKKLAMATQAQIEALTDHLASHWVQSGFTKDRKWAKEFSIFYVDRARSRSMGSKGIDATAQSSNSTDVIRDTLKAMRDVTRDPDTLSALTKAEAGLSQIGLGQTKRRLDVDLLAQLPSGMQVMDFYETNVADLTRRYMSRTAGTVALTEFGIHGATGARHMRDSIMAASDNPTELATRKELEAFDRVMSEMLGTPVEGAVQSQVATNLRMLTSIQRLGGTVYNQFAESFNIVGHLGFSALLGKLSILPKSMGEVGRLKKGAPSGNNILTSIEQIGGEIGMDNFKLVMPLDAPDAATRAYGQDQGLLARLLSAGQHAQSKVTFFRGLMAAQHRATAEQITIKAIKFARDMPAGTEHVNLKDMGFDKDLMVHIKNNLGRIARFDASGNVTHLDITQLPNMKAAEEFVAAVHRGTSQIIQGTFIGERSAWLHNDWAKLGLQMRTFGLTAVEKQWGRTRMNHGYAHAAGLLLGTMAMAVPLHLARVHAASLGREDRDAFVKKNLSPYAVLRATLNYASLAGVLGDVMDVMAGIGGGWSDEVAETVGAQAGTQGSALSVGRLIPAVGSLDAAGRVATGHSTLYNALKQLPGSNIPWLVPLINLTK